MAMIIHRSLHPSIVISSFLLFWLLCYTRPSASVRLRLRVLHSPLLLSVSLSLPGESTVVGKLLWRIINFTQPVSSRSLPDQVGVAEIYPIKFHRIQHRAFLAVA